MPLIPGLFDIPSRDKIDTVANELLIKQLGPVAGGYFGDLLFNLGEKRGMLKRDYSPAGLQIMKDMVSAFKKEGQTKGSINPGSVESRGLFQPKEGEVSPIERHITSPYAEVMNSLGKFDWEINKEGEVEITDEGYDWEHSLDKEGWLGKTGSTSSTGGKVKQFAKKLAYHTT